MAKTEIPQSENNAHVVTTTVMREGNLLLKQDGSTLYYMIVTTNKGRRIIGIGKKTYDEITKITS